MDRPTRIKSLIEKSAEVKGKAYCPYSKFPVGAAVLCQDGSIFTGCNVENAAYPLGVCAEKLAVSKAVSEGHREFTAIAVSSEMEDTFIAPCGECRQNLAEFGMDWDVYMTKPDGTFLKKTVGELLPYGFSPKSLISVQQKSQ